MEGGRKIRIRGSEAIPSHPLSSRMGVSGRRGTVEGCTRKGHVHARTCGGHDVPPLEKRALAPFGRSRETPTSAAGAVRGGGAPAVAWQSQGGRHQGTRSGCAVESSGRAGRARRSRRPAPHSLEAGPGSSPALSPWERRPGTPAVAKGTRRTAPEPGRSCTGPLRSRGRTAACHAVCVARKRLVVFCRFLLLQ